MTKKRFSMELVTSGSSLIPESSASKTRCPRDTPEHDKTAHKTEQQLPDQAGEQRRGEGSSTVIPLWLIFPEIIKFSSRGNRKIVTTPEEPEIP
jgi:hypothetical protein